MLAAAFALAALALAALRFVDLEGRPVVLDSPAAGEALVVHYWATRCPPCGPELAILSDEARACAGSGVQLLAVDVGEPPDVVRRFLAARSLALPVALDPDGRVWRRAGGRELPTNRIWTAQGRRVSFGPRDAGAWRSDLAALGCGGDPATP